MPTFQEKRELQKIIIEQNRVLAGAPAPDERIEAERIKREAMGKLGIGERLDSESQK